MVHAHVKQGVRTPWNDRSTFEHKILETKGGGGWISSSLRESCLENAEPVDKYRAVSPSPCIQNLRRLEEDIADVRIGSYLH